VEILVVTGHSEKESLSGFNYSVADCWNKGLCVLKMELCSKLGNHDSMIGCLLIEYDYESSQPVWL